jgi:hypothetical protein
MTRWPLSIPKACPSDLIPDRVALSVRLWPEKYPAITSRPSVLTPPLTPNIGHTHTATCPSLPFGSKMVPRPSQASLLRIDRLP